MRTDSLDAQCRPISFLVVDDDAFMLKLISRSSPPPHHGHVCAHSGTTPLPLLKRPLQ